MTEPEMINTNLHIRTNILNPVSNTEYELLSDQLLTIDNGKIISIKLFPKTVNCEYLDYSDCLTFPGLIDIHVHLSQYRIRGYYRDSLLPWLEEFVFPEESKSIEEEYAFNLAKDFFQALLRAGTTTAVIYTAPYQTACEAAFRMATVENYRAFIGMTMMDSNSPQNLIQDTGKAITTSKHLITKWHGTNNLQYIFTPRFAPTCSMKMMKQISDFARTNDLWIQTHLSENKDEIQWVKEIFGLDTYTGVYEKAGLLTQKTILAHCVHLSDEEMQMLKQNGCLIAHCPDSNFFLRSGEFPLEEINRYDIPFALGSDVGAGTSLNMLYHAKMYIYRQFTYHIPPADAFYRITLGAAEALGLDAEVGSISPGKDANLVILKLPFSLDKLDNDIVSELIFTGSEWQTKAVFLKGQKKV